MTLGIWLLTLAGLPPAVAAGRDLATNFRLPDVDFAKATAHAKARTAAIAFAMTAPPLCAVSPAVAVVFWILSMVFTFVLLPNRILTDTRKAAQ